MLLTEKSNTRFDPAVFLAHSGIGRKLIALEPRETLFTQGDQADSVFYLQSGRAKVTVVSTTGKEATVSLLSAGDFVGEESLAVVSGLRLSTATAVNTCAALKISRGAMISKMHEEPGFADFFFKFLLAKSMKTQADLVDQLFNSSEKRVARILLLMEAHTVPRELLHESLSQARLHRLQRTYQGEQVAAQCRAARSITRTQRRKACDEFPSVSQCQAAYTPQARAFLIVLGWSAIRLLMNIDV